MGTDVRPGEPGEIGRAGAGSMEARRVTERAGRGGGGGTRRRRTALIALLWLALAPGWVTPAHARARGGIDAVLVLDSSGSMRHTDPLRLRVPAAKLFISLLGAGDRVGVISFSGHAWPVIGLTDVTGAS
ncbi:MAG TPA: VWA domain-containing protein, partial [Chromatiales bacterium]|nr:VWA domain-containing protein [Chromatiales bacterium]